MFWGIVLIVSRWIVFKVVVCSCIVCLVYGMEFKLVV